MPLVGHSRRGPLFFIASTCRQIRGVNKAHGFLAQRSDHQDLLGQVIINQSQSPDAKPCSELVKHARIGYGTCVGQMRKTAERALFGQGTLRRIEAASTGQRRQQMRAPKLRGAEM